MKFKLNPKQIMLIVMSVLLVAVIIMTCVVIGKISNLFQSMDDPGSTTTPSGVTEPSTEPTDSTDPSDPSSEPTDPPQTEPSVEPHEHNFVKTETVKPTCMTEGYTTYTCTVCGLPQFRDMMDPKGHEFGEPVIFELTCEQDGYTELTCLRCGITERHNEEKAPGHDYQFSQNIKGSCTVDGGNEFVCTRCGDKKLENLVPATGHDFTGWIPVEGDPAKEKRTCVICLEIEYRDLAVEQDWEGSKFTVADVDSRFWTHHIVMITLKSTNTSFKYDIYIGLENREITYNYSADGLTVTYMHAGESKTYTLPADAPGVMTVYSDGSVIDAVPDNVPAPSEPTEPSDPTDATDPTEPSEPAEATDPTESTDPTGATENIEN